MVRCFSFFNFAFAKKMSVADVTNREGHFVDGGGGKAPFPEAPLPRNLMFMRSNEYGSIVTIVAPHPKRHSLPMAEAAHATELFKQMSELSSSCFKLLIEHWEYHERQAQLVVQANAGDVESLGQLDDLRGPGMSPAPLCSIMQVTTHDIPNDSLLDVVLHKLKMELDLAPEPTRRVSPKATLYWAPPRDQQERAPQGQKTYATATTANTLTNQWPTSRQARGHTNQPFTTAAAQKRVESPAYVAHRDKVSAEIATAAVTRDEHGKVTAYDPQRARELFKAGPNRPPPRFAQSPLDSLIVSGLPADFGYADAREMLRQVAPGHVIEVLRLPFVQQGEEKYMLLKLESIDEATATMAKLNAVTLQSASRPLRARFAKQTVLGRDQYRALMRSRETKAADGMRIPTADYRGEKESVEELWASDHYYSRHQRLMSTVARAEPASVHYIYLKWVAELAEELFPQEGERVARAFMADAPPVDTLAEQLGYPSNTASRIRAARDAVLSRTHLQKRLSEMPEVVQKACALTDEHKRDQMLADSLFPAVAEIVQGHQAAGDITCYLVRKGGNSIMMMCESVELFTGKVKALETATENDEQLRAAMMVRPRNLALDGVDFSPRSSPTSLFEQWCTTWDADTDPQKVTALTWKLDAITGLVELYSPSGTSSAQKKMMVNTLAADTSPDCQEWFSGMLVNPQVAFKLATAAILEGRNWKAVSDYLQGGLGGGATEPPFVAKIIEPESPGNERHLEESAGHDIDDILAHTQSRDHSGESPIIVPETPPTMDHHMDKDQAWTAANEQARLAECARPAGEKHARHSSPLSGELFPAKRIDADDQPTSVPDSQQGQRPRATVTTQRTATSVQDQDTSTKKGTSSTNKSGKAPASHGAGKPSSRALSTSATDTAQGKPE